MTHEALYQRGALLRCRAEPWGCRRSASKGSEREAAARRDAVALLSERANELFIATAKGQHSFFERIHSFIGGDGRTGGLVLNLICHRHPLPTNWTEHRQAHQIDRT